ncbi:MAG: Hpt domain-containing protein [Lachnospiraceae bacterium]|nr:Hpt domain-containing protein [Lachnospiraceae bacterium]
MKLEQFYKNLGGSYQEIKDRLQSDDLIQRFTLKFLNDKSYETLCKAVEEENYDEAFRAAHTLKGVCQNLSFGNLSKSSSELTELLRNRATEPVDMDKCKELLSIVSVDYRAVTVAIESLQA